MSNYVKATNFRIKDSLTTGDPNKRIKGAEIDDEFVALSTAISSKADSASPTFTGTPTAPTASSGTNSNQLATTAFVFQNSVPVGAILMWGGSILSLPSGYALCDGTSGTPDLRNRFIIGAGTTYSVGSTGGSADAVVVSHTHTVTDAGHVHQEQVNGADWDDGAGSNGSYVSGSSQPRSVKLSGVNTASATTGITLNSTGEDGTGKNLPPYYALAFIQRVS